MSTVVTLAKRAWNVCKKLFDHQTPLGVEITDEGPGNSNRQEQEFERKKDQTAKKTREKAEAPKCIRPRGIGGGKGQREVASRSERG